MTKLLYASLYGKLNDFYDAFKDHFDVQLYQGVDHALTFKPDVIHIHSGALPPDELNEIKKHIKCFVTQFTGDASTGLLEPVTYYKGLADLTLLTVGIGQKELYEKHLGHPVLWMPEAIRLDQCNEPKKDVDKITFIGNYYDHLPEGNNRAAICRLLAKKYPNQFECYGSMPAETNCKGSIPYEQSHGKYNNSYIGIAHDNYSIPMYFSHRYLGIMANTYCIGKQNGSALPFMSFYNDNESLLHHVETMFNNPDLRYEQALNSYKYIKENFLYSHWMERYKHYIKA